MNEGDGGTCIHLLDMETVSHVSTQALTFLLFSS